MAFRTLRLRIKDDEQTPKLVDHPVIRAVGAGKSRTLDRTEIIYDTSELTLRRRGIFLTGRRFGGNWVGCINSTGDGGDETLKEWECGLTDAPPDWTDLKKHLPDKIFDGIKGKPLEPLFEIDRLEERWRLDFPDNTRIVIRELRGALRCGSVKRLFHEVVLDGQSGSANRFYQTALALGRYFSAVLEPLNPVLRGYVRRDPSLLLLSVWNGSKAGQGDGVGRALSGAGEPLLYLMLDSLAPLIYGTEEIQQEAAVLLDQTVVRLRTLIELFHALFPDRLRKDMETELAWLAGELEPLREWNGLIRNVLVPMVGRFPEYPMLGQALEKAEKRRKTAFKQVVTAMESLRLTQMLLGFASWLIGEEGLKAFLLETDPLLRDRMSAPAEGVVRETLRRTHRQFVDHGLQYTPGQGECAVLLGEADTLSNILTLFSGLFSDKKISRYQEVVADLGRELRFIDCLGREQRLWLRLVPGKDEPVRHLFNGWQGARMEQGVMNYQRAKEAFLESPLTFT